MVLLPTDTQKDVISDTGVFASKPQEIDIVLENKPQDKIKVVFSNRGFSKVVKSVNSLDEKTPDRESIANISKIFDDMKIDKGELFGFPSIEELFGIDYVGYIIEKERLDKKTGRWIRIDEYRIIGAQANSFKDSRIAYGNLYRYRIKSVVKVTVAEEKISHENFELYENVKRQERDRIKRELKIIEDVLANIERVTNTGLKSKVSSGKESTIFELLEGLKIVADEKKTSYLKDSIRDDVEKISQLRRLKNLRVRDTDIVKGTISISALQKEINDNFKRIKEKIFGYTSYYFESEPNKGWIYVSAVENIPPPSPSSIKITPNTPKKHICLTWLKPANSQRDIKFYRIYRRQLVGQAWTILTTLSEKDNLYLDEDVLVDQKYIYAITCIDAHGTESFLSAQIECQLNSNFVAEKEEKKIKLISGSGTTPDDVTLILKKFQDEEEPIIIKNNFSFKPTREFNEIQKKLLVRATSLDTHEKKEFSITINNVNIKNVDI